MNQMKPPQTLLDFVERYQRLYTKDPKSRFFAPLVEGYRQMGFLKQAESIAKEGLEHHPHFAAGHVCYAKVLLELQQSDLAIQHLQKAVELSPENLLASRLLGEAYIKKGKPKEALRCFKTVLFFAPKDLEAAKKVKQLESLSADDYPTEVFQMMSLSMMRDKIQAFEDEKQDSVQSAKPTVTKEMRHQSLETAISLADAFFIRNNFQRSLEIIESALQDLGPMPQLVERRKLLLNRGALPGITDSEKQDGVAKAIEIDQKIRKLEGLLAKIEASR
jgi:tetratricopeptide (TPR) repeat protein